MAIKIRKLDSTDNGFQQQLHTLLAFEAATDDAIESAVAKIPAARKARRDSAVLENTNPLDRRDAASLAANRAKIKSVPETAPVFTIIEQLSGNLFIVKNKTYQSEYLR